MKKNICSYLIFVLCSFFSYGQESDLFLSEEYPIRIYESNQLLPPLKWIIKEGAEELSIQDLQKGNIKDAEIITFPENERLPVIITEEYWCKIVLSSEVELNDWILDVHMKGNTDPFIQTFAEVNAYFLINGKNLSRKKSGARIPASQRSIESIFSKSYISFNISPKNKLEVWIKVTIGENGNIEFPISIIKNDVDLSSQYSALHLSEFLLGALSIIFSIGTMLLFWFREKVYIWFLAFIAINLISVLSWSFQDEITYTLFAEFPLLRYLMLSLGDSFKWIILLLFCRVFIDSPKAYPKLDKVFLRLIILLLFFLPIFLLDTIYFLMQEEKLMEYPFVMKGIMVINSLVFLGILFCLGYFIFSKNKLARFFGIGAITPFLGMPLVQLSSILDSSIIRLFADQLIIFGPIITLSLALAYRFKLIHQEKQKAQERQLQIERNQSEQLRKLNTASAKFVPSTFLNFLGKKNILEATLGDYVEKQVTVLFSDIRDYTTLSEQMTPEENFRFVNAFNQRMGPIIQEHQGFVNQYLGDGIMAIFPENSEDTLRASIKMQQSLHVYNQSRISKNKTPLRMGIGIHSGPLIMGIIGDEKRMDAATISDTVNAASRIEGLTKHFGVNILLSEAVVKKLNHPEKFNLRFLGLVQVKGKQEVIKIYECFDGDSEEEIQLKQSSLLDFENAIKFYLQKQFENAILLFEKILLQNPTDRVCKIFLERSKEASTNGVNDSWTGVEFINFK